MSYCRCSDTCDVYVYPTSGGYMTHIAGGQVTFRDRSRKKLLERLTNLRTAGFKVSDAAFDRLHREIGLNGHR